MGGRAGAQSVAQLAADLTKRLVCFPSSPAGCLADCTACAFGWIACCTACGSTCFSTRPLNVAEALASGTLFWLNSLVLPQEVIFLRTVACTQIQLQWSADACRPAASRAKFDLTSGYSKLHRFHTKCFKCFLQRKTARLDLIQNYE